MGLFSFLNKRTKQIHDDVFGLITFRPYKLLKSDYFVGSIYFAPTANDVDLFIYADQHGPTQAQKDFFKKIEDNYRKYVEMAIPLFLDTFKQQNNPVDISNFNQEFTLACIVIPEMKENDNEWKLEFSTIHDENNHYTVVFINDKPARLMIDEN